MNTTNTQAPAPEIQAIIIGAGPAGLTAGYELLSSGKAKVLVLESTAEIGGISRTVNHNGNRLDMGGHRFFSKSQRVMKWWADMMPVLNGVEGTLLAYQGNREAMPAGLNSTSCDQDAVLLVRPRRSRIYFLKRFFDYPLRLSWKTLTGLGPFRLVCGGVTYLWARINPRRPEKTLEDFLINRFGGTLYRLFFASYTEKVWGRPCSAISAEWGAQRIKGLSISKAIIDALARPFRKDSSLTQNNKEVSLIERFLYPRFGPGQMWETCADRIRSMGGDVMTKHNVVRIHREDFRIISVEVLREDGSSADIQGSCFLSTMPVRDLVMAMCPPAPECVREVAESLPYRSFLTVGLLVAKLAVSEDKAPPGTLIRDNWIYIQDSSVRIGRLQIFNNWSSDMVARPDETVWLGLEYFCEEGDDLWNMDNNALIKLGETELIKIGLIGTDGIIDGTVVRVPKAYPAYFGSYERFDEVRAWLDQVENLYLIGRNGMHRYNNQDHSMLAAMEAAKQILSGVTDRQALWSINADKDYHESISK